MNAKQLNAMTGRIVSHQSELEGLLSTEDVQWAIQHPKTLMKLIAGAIKNRGSSTILGNGRVFDRFLGDEVFIIEPKDVNETFADASTLIDKISYEYDRPFEICNPESIPYSVEAVICVCRQSGLTPDQVVSSLRVEKTRLCLTQSQIIDFIEKYGEKIPGGFISFLMESKEKIYLVNYYEHEEGDYTDTSLSICKLEDFEDYLSGGSDYFVFPKWDD